jgi:phytoene synthase
MTGPRPAADPAAAEWRFPNRATPPGSSAYYSVRLAPAELRDDLAAVLAWRHEVRAVLDRVSDPGVARIKLQWWREELVRTAAGDSRDGGGRAASGTAAGDSRDGGGRAASGTAAEEPRHPLSAALAPVMARHRLPPVVFLAMANRVQAELSAHQAADREALEAGCEADLGALFDLLARCHGVADAPTLAAARGLGAFCGLVYLIRDSGQHLRRGRPFLPADRLARLGLTPAALALPEHIGRLPGLLAEAAAEARAYRERAVTGPLLPASLRVRGRILAALLAVLEAEGFDLAERRVGLTPLRKLWLGWREARRGP